MSGADGEPTWATIAAWYDDLVAAGSGPHELATATTLRLVRGQRGDVVLEVGCGQGLATRALAAAGFGDVTGVDSSPEMIALAREHEAADPRDIRYEVDSAQALETVSNASVDGAICQLALMDIADLNATLRSVHRVLRAGGWFAFVIGHPCFLAPEATTIEDSTGRTGRFISEYFDERFWRSSDPNGVRRVGNYHRTVSTYLNALIAMGFILEQAEEPPAMQLLAEKQPVYGAVPIFFAARARRP